jgi:hypothetical protein
MGSNRHHHGVNCATARAAIMGEVIGIVYRWHATDLTTLPQLSQSSMPMCPAWM